MFWCVSLPTVFKMKSLLAAIILIGLTVGIVDGIQCFQCTYNDNPSGFGYECVAARENQTISVKQVECPTYCQESATVMRDNTLFTFSRGCARNDSNSSCCANRGQLVTCYSVCDDDHLCNNASYDVSAPINSQARCPAPEEEGKIPCNSCGYAASDTDTSCLDDPLGPKVGFLQCETETKECTIISQRLAADPSKVISYGRSCYPKDSLPYGRTEDSTYITWICRCNTPYCNDNVEDGTEADCDYYEYYWSGSSAVIYRRPDSCSTMIQLFAMVTVSFLAALSSIHPQT